MKIGNEIRRFARCGSTMDEARVRALAGAPEGLVVVADEQTAGRGTKGRTWHSPPGTGLYATFLFRPAAEPTLLPLAVGLAVLRAAAETAPAVRLKWPNDLVWEGRKIAGVLCEGGPDGSGGRFVLAGIGINVGQTEEDFPPSSRPGPRPCAWPRGARSIGSACWTDYARPWKHGIISSLVGPGKKSLENSRPG